MSHYERRLEADLADIRGRVGAIGEAVLAAIEQAVAALLAGDRAQAYETILGDLAINRAIRALDRKSHAFVARHLPSAGHLRFVSAVLRIAVAIERIGDYAVTIAREAVQLSAAPPAGIARDVEPMAEQCRQVLRQALEAFDRADTGLAQGTVAMARQIDDGFDRVYADLVAAGESEARPVTDLFALLMVLNRLERIADQAKNVCEETLFAATGETKAPKVYQLLFVDPGDDFATQMARAVAAKTYPEGGDYQSAGWRPAERLRPGLSDFLERRGIDLGEARPTALEARREALNHCHVLISLGGDPRPHLPAIPYHTVVQVWDLDRSAQDADDDYQAIYRQLATRIHTLMEALHGDEAS